MKLQDLQADIKELVERINKTHEHDKPELISYMKVVEEIGEITELVLSTQIKSRKHNKKSAVEVREEIGDEISDAIIALISLANDFDVNLTESIEKKMKKHSERN